MGKKILIILLFFAFLFLSAAPAFAMQVPLQRSGRSAFPAQDDNITLVSYLANLRVRTGFTSVNATMVIRNDSLSQVELLMGIPTQLDDIVTVNQISVMVEGSSQKLSIVRGKENPEQSHLYSPPKWHTFTLVLAPGETKVVDYAFSMDNKSDELGCRTIYFPLHYLKTWKGPIKYLQIIADLDFYPPYVFEPDPSIIPDEYEGGGRLLWRFTDVREPSELSLYFRPVEIAIVNYLKLTAPKDAQLDNILNLYEKRSFDSAIQSITDFIDANPSYEYKTELEFIKALSYLELFQPGMALEIFNRIEQQPGFGSQLHYTIGNKIIYDKISLLKLMDREEEIIEYIEHIKPSVKNNTVFANWLEDELQRLSPPPDPVPQEPVPEQPDTDEDQNEPLEDDNKTIKNVNIFGYDVPVEILFAAIILIVVIIYTIRSKRRKRRKRFYY